MSGNCIDQTDGKARFSVRVDRTSRGVRIEIAVTDHDGEEECTTIEIPPYDARELAVALELASYPKTEMTA